MNIFSCNHAMLFWFDYIYSVNYGIPFGIYGIPSMGFHSKQNLLTQWTDVVSDDDDDISDMTTMFEQSLFQLNMFSLSVGRLNTEVKMVYSTLCLLFECQLHYASVHEKICLWFKTLPLLMSLIQSGLYKLLNKSFEESVYTFVLLSWR